MEGGERERRGERRRRRRKMDIEPTFATGPLSLVFGLLYWYAALQRILRVASVTVGDSNHSVQT